MSKHYIPLASYKGVIYRLNFFHFKVLLILASQRIETIVGGLWDEEGTGEKLKDIPIKRGESPTIIEWVILIWVMGQIWDEVKQLWTVGIQEYVTDMWNIIDFVTNSLYVATVALRIVSYCQVRMLDSDSHIPREKWDAWDPMLLSEGLFSAANIFSSLKLVYIFSVNPHLGPLQISLSRMVMDIIKFFFLYVLVLFAFSSGLNQLLWSVLPLQVSNLISKLYDTLSGITRVWNANAASTSQRVRSSFKAPIRTPVTSGDDFPSIC